MNIIIVGGSLGGLFAAVAVKRSNQAHNIRVLERSPVRLHDQGAGIVAGSETTKFFKRFDPSKSTVAIESPYRHYLNFDGTVSSRKDWPQNMTSYDLLYNVLRWNFDGDSDDGYVSKENASLANGANGEHRGSTIYSLGCTVESMREVQNPDGKLVMEVSFKDADGATQTATADLVIGADGPSSTVRSLLDPSATREYCGYVVWRGMIPETPLSDSTRETMVDRFTFYHAPGNQALAYIIPGERGSVERGSRIVNWAWYCNYPADSPEYKELMTDTDGKTHRITLPPGKMNPDVWKRQREYAQRTLPPQFAELVTRTDQAFVQTITDVIAQKPSYFGGKVLLLGDALAGFRPHTAASTSQAGFDASLLYDYLKGDVSIEEWERQVMEYATEVQRKGMVLGQSSQFSDSPMHCATGERGDILSAG